MLKPFNWYQDKNTVKIYIYLEGVERENIEVEFKPMSFDVRFHEMKGKNYRCFVPEILPEKCAVVMRLIRIEITLVKASEGIWKDLQLSKEHVSTSFPTPTVNTAVNAVNVSSNRALNDSMLASPRKYENDGVGLSMVAAMKDSAVVKLDNLVLSSAKVADNFIIEKCKARFFTSKARPLRNPEEEDAKKVPQHLLRYDRPDNAGDTSVNRGYPQLALKKYKEENCTDFCACESSEFEYDAS